jgi:hypothetical protein
MPPGRYRVNVEAELLSGEHVTESVEFEVYLP